MKKVVRAAIVMFATGALVNGAACSKSPLGFSINTPASVSQSVTWYEIGAFRGAACSVMLPTLGGGIPEGFTARYAFKKDDPTTPQHPFGNVPTAKYAFATVARDDKCGIVATGCTDVDVDNTDSIVINLGPLDPPSPGCNAGDVCEAAKCVPANDNSDPSVGANCSLQLLGAGPLANTAGVDGTIVSAPAIVTTSKGFMIVYRETDPSGTAHLVLLPVDTSGGSQRPTRPGLKNTCNVPEAADGIGLAVNGNDGFVTLSRPACSGSATPTPGLDLFLFQVSGSEDPTAPGVVNLFDSAPPGDSVKKITLGAAHPSTQKPSGNLVTFVEDGQPELANINTDTTTDNTGIIGPNGAFGPPNSTGAWMTMNDKVLALLAAVPGSAPLPSPTGDGGGIGDDDDGGGTTSSSGGGIVGTTDSTSLSLLMLDANTDIKTIATSSATAISINGTVGSLAATGGRVLILTDGSGPGRSANYHAFDLGKSDEADNNGFALAQPTSTSTAKVTAVDVAIVGDRAFMVALEQGQVGLQVFDHATTTLTPLRNVDFLGETRISGISTVRDGAVSVAASDKRVGVVWTTAKTLTRNDAAGGYAVFACTQ
jgi:hypothetical protein